MPVQRLHRFLEHFGAENACFRRKIHVCTFTGGTFIVSPVFYASHTLNAIGHRLCQIKAKRLR